MTPTQITREKELVAKYAANLISPASPALTPAERAEVAELFEETV